MAREAILKFRKLLKRLGLYVGIVLVLVTLAEAAARLLGFAPVSHLANSNLSGREYNWAAEDARAGWMNRVGVFRSREAGAVPMTFWSDGRRATRPNPEKSGSTALIILAGCSITQGYGIADSETMGWRLQEHNPSLDVENYGTGGYGTYQTLLRLEEVLAERTASAQPALVVYNYFSWHVLRDIAPFEWVLKFRDRQGAYFAPPSVTIAEGSLVEHPLIRFAMWPLEDELALVAMAKRAYLHILFMGREDDFVAAGKLVLARLKDVVRRHGAQLLIVSLDPGLLDKSSPELLVWHNLLQLTAEKAPEMRRFIETEIADGKQTHFLDCSGGTTLFRPEFRVGGVGHPNGEANRRWANCLQNWFSAHPPFGPPGG